MDSLTRRVARLAAFFSTCASGLANDRVLAAVRLGASGSYLCRIAARAQTYWQKHLGAARTDPSRVLDIPELQSHWSGEDDDGIETFDFTLPEGVTNPVKWEFQELRKI